MTPLVLLSLSLAAPVPKAPEKAEEKFDGVWVIKSMEYRGNDRGTPPEALRDTYTLVIAGGNYVFRTHGGTIKFDKEKKTFEVAVTGGTYKGETSGGVFERDGDTLKLAMPSIPRTATAKPTELKTGPNTTHYLYTFERAKDTAADKVAEQLKTRTAALPNRANPFNPAPFPGGIVAPGRPVPAAAQLQEALERIEKLEKRIEELEKAAKGKKDEKK